MPLASANRLQAAPTLSWPVPGTIEVPRHLMANQG